MPAAFIAAPFTSAPAALLVAAHALGLTAPDATGGQPPGSGCLALFRIGDNGTLSFLRKYDVEVGARQLFWMGMVGCAAACLKQNRGACRVLHVRPCRHDGEIE